MKTWFYLLLLAPQCLMAQTITFSIEGDSISDSDPNRWSAYFKPMMDAKFGGVESYNIWATSGDTVSNMFGEYATQAHTVAPGTNIGFFTLWVPINDIDAGDTDVNMESNTATLWADSRTDLYKTVAFIPTPNYNWTNGDPRWQVWSNYCAWVHLQTNSYDYLVPAGEVLTESDLIDGLHPSASGAMKAALLVSNTLFSGQAMMAIDQNNVTLHAPVANTYEIQTSSDLTNWTTVYTNIVPASGTFVLFYSDTNSQGFYRAQFVR